VSTCAAASTFAFSKRIKGKQRHKRRDACCVYMFCSSYFLLLSGNVLNVSSGTHTGSLFCVTCAAVATSCCFSKRIKGKQQHTHREPALCLHVLQRLLLISFRKRIKGKQRHTHSGLLCGYMCCTGSFLLPSASVLKVGSGTHTGSLLCVYMCCSGYFLLSANVLEVSCGKHIGSLVCVYMCSSG
jgi:hypothetical protein